MSNAAHFVNFVTYFVTLLNTNNHSFVSRNV